MSSETYSRRSYPPQGRQESPARPRRADPPPHSHYRETAASQMPPGRGGRGDDPMDDPERMYESFNDLYDEFDEGRSKTPFVVIGALLAVAIVGGGLAFAYKRGASDGGDQPAVIRADRAPAKVEPDSPGGLEIPHQDRQVFDQVAGRAEETGEPRLEDTTPAIVPQSEDTTAFSEPPPEDNAAIDVSSPGEGSPLTIGALANRVAQDSVDTAVDTINTTTALLPSGGAQPQAELPAPISPNASDDDASVSVFEPRRVQTVEIAPDGRIVPGDQGAAQPSGQSVDGAGSTILAPAGRQEVQLPSGAGATARTLGQQAALPEVASGVSSTDLLPQSQNAAPEEAQTTLFAPSPRPKPRPTARQPQQEAALQPQNSTAFPQIQQPQSTETQPAGNLEGFAVQVASHRRQADAVAKFADLKQRFPSLIGEYQPLIQRADLGDRGVFFRLRIGPITSRSDANSLCNSLRNAGLPGCFVRNL